MTRHLLRIGAAVMTTLLGLWVVWLLRGVLLYVLVALALAGAVTPLFRGFGRMRGAVRLGWLLVYLLILGAFLLFFLEAGTAAARDVQGLAEALSEQDAWQQPEWVQGDAVERFLNERLPPPSLLIVAVAGERGQRLLPILLGVTQAVIGVLSGTLVILFLGLYWSANRTHFQQLWLSLLPLPLRKYARGSLLTVERDLGRYIRAEFFQSLLVGVLLGIGYWALGSPYPALLAVIGALANLVPVVGVFIAMLVPPVVGLLSSLQISLFTTLLTGLVLLAVKLWLKPRLYRQQQQNPILTILLLLALADAFGLPGIIAAPPLAAALQILWNLWVSIRAGGLAGQPASLRERHQRLAERISELESPPPFLTSSLARLSALIERSEPVLGSPPPEPREE